jgi:endo-1,4-beta-D-glucanase Y
MTMTALYFLPYSPTTNYPSTGDYKAPLQNTWVGYKQRFINSYSNGLVHDPSNYVFPNGSTSEGQAYGLLISIYMNDQAAFDGILDSLYTYMYNKNGKGLFTWIVKQDGTTDPANPDHMGSATDADIVITLALTFADTLVKTGKWTNTGKDYGGKAQTLINEVWTHDVDFGLYLNPGDSSNYSNAMNPSYFFTAAMKVFDEFESTHHDWPTIENQCFTTLQYVHPGGTGGYNFGLAPDWCTPMGATSDWGNKSVPPYNTSLMMYYDGIRTPWVMAIDSIWYSDSRAMTFCQKGMNYLNGTYGNATGAAQNCRMYFMDGLAIDAANWGHHTLVSTAMWASGSMGSGYSASQSAFDLEYKTNWSANTGTLGGYWGASGSAYDYFGQSLCMFGALVMGGNFVNVYKDLKPLLETTTPTSTLTQTYTPTRTPSPTFTPTVTKTNTKTPVFTYTFTPTLTKTNTLIPAITYTPTPTATLTAIPSSTITGTPIFSTLTPTVAVPTNTPIVPSKIELRQNYPNGFSSISGTSIPFQIDSAKEVKITIFSIAGREIKKFELGNIPAGVYYDKTSAVHWDGKDGSGKDCPKGVYLCAMTADGKIVGVKKMIKKD